MKRISKVFLFCLLVLFNGSLLSQDKGNADLIIVNGKILTMDEEMLFTEAVAVKGNLIYMTGRSEDIIRLKGNKTKVIDLKGNFMMPGFNESHAHLWGLGEFKKNVDLTQCKDWKEVVSLIKERVKKVKPGEWIIGRGWHQEKWTKAPQPNVNGFPVHEDLSGVSPDNPVLLKHASGHAVFANAKAMELAGINKNTPDPAGGNIMRGEDGGATGVFHENAADLIQKQYNLFLEKRSSAQKKEDGFKTLESAMKECAEKGITSFTDAGSNFEDIDLLKSAADGNKLKIRIAAMLEEKNDKLKDRIKEYRLIGYGNRHLTVRQIKKYIDGALGSRSAWFLEPYSDMPSQSGINVTPLEELKETAEIAGKYGFQLCIHSIGDRANREVLNLYENIFSRFTGKKDLRWRIEHAQHLSAEDIPRFAKLGVIAAMQPCHCTSDASFVIRRIGEKRAGEGAYVWRELMKSGAVICSGTDAPVEDVNPVKNFYSAVTRKYEEGKEFYPEQKLSRLEALKTYTVNGAYATFEEKVKGKIKEGMLADFTVLSNDLINCNENEIPKTKVLYTIVGGKTVYAAQ